MAELEVYIREALGEKMDALLERIKGLDDRIAEELHAWQIEDMNRKYPETQRTADGATTSVWPRSRTNTPRRRAIAIAAARNQLRKKGMLGKGGKALMRTKRPILRPVLVDRLKERMDALGKEVLSWQ